MCVHVCACICTSVGMSVVCVCVCVCVCVSGHLRVGQGLRLQGKCFSFWLLPFPQRGCLCVWRGVSRKDQQKLWGQKQSPPGEEGHTDPGPPSP